MMKPIKTFFTITLIIVTMCLTKTEAQQLAKWKGSTYQFKSMPSVAKGDSLHKHYCMIRKAELLQFVNITIKFNNTAKKFLISDIFKEKSDDYLVQGNFVLFLIEKLDVPFVVIEGEDNTGIKHCIKHRDNRGNIFDPSEEKTKWKKAKERVDSMDFVRKFDNVFLGKDGKPRYKNKEGKVFIIEKSTTVPENNNSASE